MHILLVDDEQLLRDTTRMVMEMSAHTVVPAASGPEAVELYARGGIDMVLMDVDMPGAFNGIEATRQIVASDPTACIVVWSANDHQDDAIMAGAWHFLDKADSAVYERLEHHMYSRAQHRKDP